MRLEDRFEGFRFERNPSWRQSALQGLKFGLWLAPTTLMVAVGRPLADAAMGLLYAILRGVAWAVVCLVLIGAGLAGFVVTETSNQN